MPTAKENYGMLQNLLLPPGSYCYICGAQGEPGMGGCCPGCIRLLEHRHVRCTACRRLLPQAVGAGRRRWCGGCRVLPPPYAGLTPLGTYSGPLRWAIGRFKYAGETHLGRPLGRALGRRVLTEGPWVQLVTPVPTNRARLRTRGFNQARILAGFAAGVLGVPVAETLQRVGERPQVSLSRAARWESAGPSFRLRAGAGIAGARVLLVDDVVTTGATLHACSRILLAGGAAMVWCAVVADALRLRAS